MTIFHGGIHCPTCKGAIDLGLGLRGTSEQPKAGDVAVCARCLELLMFTGPTTVGVLNAELLEQLQPRVRSALADAQKVLATHAQPAQGN